MPPSSLVPAWTTTRAEIARLCCQYGPALSVAGIVDPQGKKIEAERLMWALALNESFHHGPELLAYPPRHEGAYDAGGRNASDAKQAQLLAHYGSDAAKSYGPWQVMLVNAPGFAPDEFTDPEKGAQAFVGFFNRYIVHQAPPTLDAVGDAYNSGNWRDHIVPAEYIARLRLHYATEMPPQVVDG